MRKICRKQRAGNDANVVLSMQQTFANGVVDACRCAVAANGFVR
jgi:hypothetical protein